MYVFAHLGAPPTTSKCAHGVLYGGAPAYLPGMGPGASASSSSWVPLAVGAVLVGGVLWLVAKGATPVLENPVPRHASSGWRRAYEEAREAGASDREAQEYAAEWEAANTDWGMQGELEPNPRGPTEDQWNKLRAQYLEADRAYDDLDVKLSVKYGKREWAPRADLKKLDQLRNRKSRIGDKMLAILDKVSPRDWHHGAPAHWIYSELSWEDAIRPANEPLSVTPPTAYGYSSPMRSNPNIDPHELEIGTEHELEHTSSRKVARRIALDHLREDPRYYKKLDATEDAFGGLFAPNFSWPLAALLIPGVPPLAENPKNPKRTEFEIATRDGGRATRVGYVEGDFATHKEKYFWEFTHLPTGMALSAYPVHETKASALAHLHKLATEGPPEHVKRLLERYPGWGGAKVP